MKKNQKKKMKKNQKKKMKKNQKKKENFKVRNKNILKTIQVRKIQIQGLLMIIIFVKI